MNRMMIFALAISALVSRTAAGDEIRRAALPAALLGTWGESSENCTTKDKSNVVIESVKYGDASGSCAVRWVVETPSAQGTNYAVHALCTSASIRQNPDGQHYHPAAGQRQRVNGKIVPRSEDLSSMCSRISSIARPSDLSLSRRGAALMRPAPSRRWLAPSGKTYRRRGAPSCRSCCARVRDDPLRPEPFARATTQRYVWNGRQSGSAVTRWK